MNAIQAFLTALSMLPQITSLVNSVVVEIEQALVGYPGAQKFAAVEAKVKSLLNALITDTKVISDIEAILAPLINAAVAAFNAAGLFKKTSATTSAAATAEPLPTA